MKQPTVICDPNQCRDILESPQYRVVTCDPAHQALGDRLGQSLPAIGFSLSHMSVCLEGDAHRTHRRLSAHMLARDKVAAMKQLPVCGALISAPFGKTGRCELMQSAVGPAVDAFLAPLIGVPVGMFHAAALPRLLNNPVPNPEQQALEADLSELLARLRRAHPGDGDDEIGARLSFATLGRNALIASVGASLAKLFETHPGAALSRIDWPDQLPETGVPFADRLCPAPEDGTVRLDLRSDPDGMLFFGKGSHRCLGRAFAQSLWFAVTQALRPLGTRVTIHDLRWHEKELFHSPEQLVVDLIA